MHTSIHHSTHHHRTAADNGSHQLLIKLLPDAKTILDDVHVQLGGRKLLHTLL